MNTGIYIYYANDVDVEAAACSQLSLTRGGVESDWGQGPTEWAWSLGEHRRCEAASDAHALYGIDSGLMMWELHDVKAGAATGSTHPSIAALQKSLDLCIGVHVRVGFLPAPHGARALVPCTVHHVAADFS